MMKNNEAKSAKMHNKCATNYYWCISVQRLQIKALKSAQIHSTKHEKVASWQAQSLPKEILYNISVISY